MKSKKQIMQGIFFPKVSCLLLMFLLLATGSGATGVNETSKTPASMSPDTRKVAETPDYLGVGPTPRGTDEAQLRVTDLTAETMINPLGIDTAIPRLSWIVEAGYNNAVQSAYEIRVSSTGSTTGDIWSSGKVDSTDCVQIDYAGPALESKTRYYWAVRVWDEKAGSSPSPWSEIAWFETAFLNQSEFGGEWINRDGEKVAAGEEGRGNIVSLPEILLRKEFTVSNKQISEARLYIAGLGLYKAYINGTRVGDRELDPAFTVPEKRVLYVTYDVTALISRGTENAIGVSLGNGWYTRNPELKLEIDITYSDGTSASIASDGSWMIDDGPTTANSVLSGETYDARLEQPGWTSAGFDDSSWTKALVIDGPSGKLTAENMEPIRVTGQLRTPVEIPAASGGNIYDFRTTRAGWAQVGLKGPRGAVVTMKYGEKLDDVGNVSNGSFMGGGVQSYTYTLRGEDEEFFNPSYSYNGYRYLQVDAPESVTVTSVTGLTVHQDVETTGEFKSSSELLNRYHEAMQASLLSNFHGFPTDCPMYEKNGWTGDGHVFSDNALINFDSENFYENWMLDHRDVQSEDGRLPQVVPRSTDGSDLPVWTYSYIHVNHALYQKRGNIRTLKENYEGMRRWMKYYEDYIEPTGYIYEGFTYGDHEAAQGSANRPKNAIFPAENDNMVFGTAFIYKAAIKMVEIAELLGHDDDAAYYRDLANKIRDAYTETMYDSERHGIFDPREPEVYQQSTNVIALAFGLVPEEDRQKVFDSLAYDVRETWDGHVSVGAVGVKFILRMLTEGGYEDLAYEAATTPTYPGWGWWFQSLDGLWTGTERIIVDTHWEAWRYFMSSSVIDSSRSHNHAFRGVIDDWLYEDIAGIEALAPMYREIEVKPTLVGDLTDAGAYFKTPLGTVSAAWEITGAFLTEQVHVPVGATATVYVPVPETGVEVSDKGGAAFVEYYSDGTGDYAVYEVGSGDYIFWTPYDPE